MDQFEFVNKLNIQRFKICWKPHSMIPYGKYIEEKAKQGVERIKTEVGINRPPSDVMIMRATSESRFLGLDGADWSMLLVGVALCGLMVLFMV
jgi:hypothetical protein